MKECKLEFKLLFEFPYWINLRTGGYTFNHYNMLKEKLDKEILIQLIELDDFIDYSIYLDNFLWSVGVEKLSFLNKIFIKEDLESETIINKNDLEELFKENQDKVNFRKPKTIVNKNYVFPIIFQEETELKLPELIEPFIEPIKLDFIYALNEFIQKYIGYFSTKIFSNDADLLGESAFSIDKVLIRIFLDDKEVTEEIGFPLGFFSHPAYPLLFPSVEKENDFIENLRNHIDPSFTRILMGQSNNFFLHGDIRIGILYLDMALESCINDFIAFFNNQQETDEKKIRKIRKTHTIGDFIKEDLEGILLNLFDFKQSNYIDSIFNFHEERNLILHKKKKRKNPIIEDMRDCVIDLIEKFESYMNYPKIIDDINKDFIRNPVGYFLESIDGGNWGKMKVFTSFSEMRRYTQNYKKTN